MADYLLTEVNVSSDEEFQDDEIIDPITQADLDLLMMTTATSMMLIFIALLIKNWH